MVDKYIVTDLNKKIIEYYLSIRKAAIGMKVSEATIESRLRKKVTKYSEFKGEKYKFNVKENTCK